jgi:hypothetical protein
LEISGTELKLIVAGTFKQLRDLSRTQGPASAAAETTNSASTRVGETPHFI